MGVVVGVGVREREGVFKWMRFVSRVNKTAASKRQATESN